MASVIFALMVMAFPAFICCYPNLQMPLDAGAKPTKPHEYPFMMFMTVVKSIREAVEDGRKVTESGFTCGGALISLPGNKDSSDIVLTAAHCFDPIGLKPGSNALPIKISSNEEYKATIYAGAHLYTEIKQSEARDVSRVVIHDLYDGPGPYDIALMKLSEALKFNSKIRSIPFPPKGYRLKATGEQCVVAGWGNIRGSKAIGPPPESLMHLNVSIQSETDCSKTIAKYMREVDGKIIQVVYDKDKMYCVYSGSPELMKPSACHGDSGSPLLCKDDNNNWIAHGITSGGAGTCDGKPSIPPIFTRVDEFAEWINEKIKSMSSL